MRPIPVLLALLLLAGCTHTGGKMITDAQIDSFQDGQSTAADVRAALGAPLSDVHDSSGIRMLGYSFSTTSINGAAFVPIVGMFAAHPTGAARTVVFSFDAKGVLVKHTVMDSTFGAPG